MGTIKSKIFNPIFALGISIALLSLFLLLFGQQVKAEGTYSYEDTYTVQNSVEGDGNDRTFKLLSQGSDKYAQIIKEEGISAGAIVYVELSGSGSDCVSYFWLNNGDRAVNPGSATMQEKIINPVSKTCVDGFEARAIGGGKGGVAISITGTEEYTISITNTSEFKLSEAQNPNKSKVYNGEQEKTTSDEAAATCEGSIPVLGWVICAVTEVADGLIGWAESALKSLLTIEPNVYGETEDGDVNALKTAWSAVRIMATLLLVGIALFMIISQILSMDVVSAYTIKKVIPRLVIATILIQLSWFLFTALIVITNTVGNAIEDLMFAPFGGANEVGNITQILADFYENNTGAGASLQTITTAGVIGGAVVIATSGGAGAALGALGLFMLGAAIGIGIAILVAFTILVLRKVAIIALLVLSPLALVAWILPNTQNIWKQWWQLFSKLLIMFPLIIALLSAGKILAWMVAQVDWGFGEGLLNFFVILVAYFGPLLLIPATFAFAGGIFSKAVGAVDGFGKNVRSKDIGGFKSMRKADKDYLKAKRKEQGYKTLGSPESNRFRRGVARYRTGTFNTGLTKGSREIMAERLDRAKTAGEAAAFDENMKAAKNTIDTSGISRYNPQQYMSSLESLAKGQSATALNGSTIESNPHVQREALDRLIQARQSSRIDSVLQYMRDNNDNAGLETWNALSKSNFSTIREPSPDLVGKEDFSKLPTTAFTTLHESRMNMWKEQFDQALKTSRDPDADPVAKDLAKEKVQNFISQLNSVSKFQAQGPIQDKLPVIKQVGAGVPGLSNSVTELLGSDGKKKLNYDPTTGDIIISDV
jgi:hypothetical protein